MADMWMPGAVREPQPGGVTLNRGLPPRATWHITWDKVTDGAQPPMGNVSSYLKRQGYCPHLMWNPFTGEIIQYYPADVGGRALNAWNEDGAVNIQIEVYFSPSVINGGKSYNTVAETPAKGWAGILEWLDTHSIPRVWPMGAPQWQGNSRDAGVWNTRAGHYGHCNVPNNTHTDPGPMPALTTTSGLGSDITPIQEDDMPLSTEDLHAIRTSMYDILQDKNVLEKQRTSILNLTSLKNIQGTFLPLLTAQAGQIAGLQKALSLLAQGQGVPIDLATVEAAAKKGAAAALEEGIKVDITVAGAK